MKRPSGTAIREAVKYWQTALGREDWAYTIKIGRMPEGEWGEANVQVEYKRVEFRFSPSAMQKHGDTVDNCVVHEWLHTYPEALAEYAAGRGVSHKEPVRQLEEALVTDLTTLVLRLHKRPQ